MIANNIMFVVSAKSILFGKIKHIYISFNESKLKGENLHRPAFITVKRTILFAILLNCHFSLTWRTQIEQQQLASQISSILLQRHQSFPLLETLNLSSKLTQNIFLQILHKTQLNPQISLKFFNWVRTQLGFKPNRKSHCLIIISLLGSDHVKRPTKPIKPMVDYLIKTQSLRLIVDTMVSACKPSVNGSYTLPVALSLVMEGYSNKRLFKEGLEVFWGMKSYGLVPFVSSCNGLLETLRQKNEIKLAWCFYGAMIRGMVLSNRSTWCVVSRIFSDEGRFDNIVRLLHSGIHSPVVYELVVDGYSKKRDFGAAFSCVKVMGDRGLEPGIRIYSSILDAACRYKDADVIDRLMEIMIEKELLPKGCPLLDYDLTIQKLCDLEKTYAAEMFFRRVFDENVKLQDATYGHVLGALSKEGRVGEAIWMYLMVLDGGITVNDSCYHAFVNALCREDPSEEIGQLLRDLIMRGFSPSLSDLSEFVASQCRKCQWTEAEAMLNVLCEKGLLLDSTCYSSLVKHYCSIRQVNKAITLHNQVDNLKGKLDVDAYTTLLNMLFKARKVDEAVQIFDCIKVHNLLSSASFVIMIREFCRLQDLRKAMKLHDQMLEMGLKPDKATYKRVISGFR